MLYMSKVNKFISKYISINISKTKSNSSDIYTSAGVQQVKETYT